MSEPQRPGLGEGPLLPVVALVISVVGLCFPPLLLVSAALGGYSLFQASRDPAWAGRKQLAQMTLAVSVAGVLIFLGLALPNMKRFAMRTRQVECREALTRLGELERKFYEKNSRYTVSMQELDPLATRGNVTLRLSSMGPVWTEGFITAEHVGLGDATVDAATPKLVLSDVGLKGTCPACTLTLSCAQNLDGDPTIDTWTLSTLERPGANGAKVPGWVPWNEVDDVTQ